jgi:hypothetical protein
VAASTRLYAGHIPCINLIVWPILFIKYSVVYKYGHFVISTRTSYFLCHHDPHKLLFLSSRPAQVTFRVITTRTSYFSCHLDPHKLLFLSSRPAQVTFRVITTRTSYFSCHLDAHKLLLFLRKGLFPFLHFILLFKFCPT